MSGRQIIDLVRKKELIDEYILSIAPVILGEGIPLFCEGKRYRMQKVDKEHFARFINLAKENTCNTVYPMSVAEGFQAGDIYTDCLESPTFALFWHVSGFAYLTGRPDKEYLDDIYKLMENTAGTNARRFILELKDEEIASYFQKKNVEKHPRYRFRLQEKETFEQILPEGYELKEVDADILLKIFGNIVPSIFWRSGKEFLEKGKGYCIMYGKEVVSVAFSAAVSSEQVDIGIETAEAHRRKGLAAIVARKMVAYVKSVHKEPVWDCNVANVGSRCTAEKVGFEIVAEHAFYKL